MKIKGFGILFVVMFGLLGGVFAMPAKQVSDGGCPNLEIHYPKIDDQGYAPRFVCGDQARFDAIAGRDPNFYAMRFPTNWQALNYWMGLQGMSPLPPPTSP